MDLISLVVINYRIDLEIDLMAGFLIAQINVWLIRLLRAPFCRFHTIYCLRISVGAVFRARPDSLPETGFLIQECVSPSGGQKSTQLSSMPDRQIVKFNLVRLLDR